MFHILSAGPRVIDLAAFYLLTCCFWIFYLLVTYYNWFCQAVSEAAPADQETTTASTLQLVRQLVAEEELRHALPLQTARPTCGVLGVRWVSWARFWWFPTRSGLLAKLSWMWIVNFYVHIYAIIRIYFYTYADR